MDYQETIDILKRNKPISDPRRCGKELCTACDVAISAMQELLEYHKTGLSPEQVADAICELSVTKRILGHYKQIGTLEELKQIKETNFTGVKLAKIACCINQLKLLFKN